MYCRNCSLKIEDPVEICPQCQHNPAGGNNFCQTCGFSTQAEDILCHKCGAKLSRLAEPTRIVSVKPRNTTALLAVLPALVGVNGVHQFYLGKIGIGIAMFLTLGGVGIWTIIDLVIILQGKMMDKEGKPITG